MNIQLIKKVYRINLANWPFGYDGCNNLENLNYKVCKNSTKCQIVVTLILPIYLFTFHEVTGAGRFSITDINF